MSGGAQALNHPVPPPPTIASQILPLPAPMKWNLVVLASTMPPFVPPDDYLRFSSIVADREAEALVVLLGTFKPVNLGFIKEDWTNLLSRLVLLISEGESGSGSGEVKKLKLKLYSLWWSTSSFRVCILWMHSANRMEIAKRGGTISSCDQSK